jgi:ribonuclease BN (tRNA processing enzyme)
MHTVNQIIVITFVVAITLSTNAQAATNDKCLKAPVSLQVLGSGGPEFYKNRASSSYLIRHNGKAVVMVDAGSGSKFRFGQSGADFNTVKVMLLTHLHVDHSADFPGYIKSAFFSDRNQDLYVYGPEAGGVFPSTKEFVAAMIGDKPSAYPYLSRYLKGGDDYQIHVKDIKLDKHKTQILNPLGDIKLSTIPVHHGPVPAVAWRVEIADKSIVFSGDMNGDYHTLETLANHADLLVAHNAIPEGATGVERFLHMPPSVIGDIASQAKVKQLVLSHRMHRTLGNESETLAIIRKKYRNPVSFANDLDCFVP